MRQAVPFVPGKRPSCREKRHYANQADAEHVSVSMRRQMGLEFRVRTCACGGGFRVQKFSGNIAWRSQLPYPPRPII